MFCYDFFLIDKSRNIKQKLLLETRLRSLRLVTCLENPLRVHFMFSNEVFKIFVGLAVTISL